MHVAVELRNIALGTSGGIAQLIRGVLLEAMLRHPECRFTIFATLFSSSLLSDDLPSNATVRVLPLHAFWQQLSNELRSDSYDVLFRPYPGLDVTGFPFERQVVLIPDMQHNFYPGFFSDRDLAMRKQLFASALRSAGAIGTISEFARRTILSDPNNRCTDVFLMPPASQLGAEEGTPLAPAFVARVEALRPFVFYPANQWKHKNHERLTAAYLRFRETHPDISLVLTGHADHASSSHVPSVIHLGYLRPEELRHVYRCATALVFPSLYEGFGIPLLEAFENDCPVACSATTSLPEVADGAALLFDPESTEAIAIAMDRIVSDDTLRAQLVANGRERASAYAWSASADAWMDACARVAERARSAEAFTGQPLVSIVTPSYNQGRFLRRTIDSVLAQAYPNIELIVMDGGSTDESVSILESYGDRITWVSEKDRGQTHAINKGMKRARGAILAYLNSDDTLEPHAIERVVRYFAENPACDMVYGDANYIDVDDRVSGRYATDDYTFERLMRDCCVCQPAAFWRSSIAARVGPFDETLDFVMDYDYWLRIDRAGGVIRFLGEVLANSRLYPETKTMSARGSIYREIFEVCRRHGGYVDRSYYHGYWHHRMNEAPGVIGRVLRYAPHGADLMAKLHHAFDHRTGSVWEFIVHDAVPRARAVLTQRARREPLAAAAPAAVPSQPRVQGFYLDGWLGPEVDVRRMRGVGEPALFVTGRPAVPCTVDVLVDGVARGTHALSPDAVSRIDVGDVVREGVSLRFSAHSLDPAARPLAFLVLGTNLFTEADLGR